MNTEIREISIQNPKENKPRKFSKSQLIKWVIIFILILVCSLLVIFNERLFKISSVNIQNTIEYEFIDKAALDQKLKSEYLNKPFFSLSLAEEEKRLEELSTFFNNVNVEKTFPNKLSIRVEEREPFLNISTKELFVIVDQKGFVISVEARSDKTINDETSDLITEISQKNFVKKDNNIYKGLPLLIANEIKTEFKAGEQSTFFDTEKIFLIDTVLNDKGYSITEIIYLDQIYEFKLDGGKFIKFSAAQDLETQLKRFVLVEGKVKEDGIDYKGLDLRYERPVMTR